MSRSNKLSRIVVALVTLSLLPERIVPARAAGEGYPRVLAAAGPAAFVDSGQNLGNASSRDAALGDVDGDGDLDAFVAAANQPNQVWLNQGGRQGGAPGTLADSGQRLGSGMAQGVALGDLDGDSDLDAVVVLGAALGTLQIWLNAGGDQAGTEGVYVANGQTIGDDYATSVALGDLDGDGDLDAFVTRALIADTVWWNDGDGQFADSGQRLGDDDSYDAALGDVDGDGDQDAVVAERQAIRIWLNQGGAQGGTLGQLTDSGQGLPSGGSNNRAVALGALDGDGDLDAFVANLGIDQIWLNQAGVFTASVQSLDSALSQDVALGDLDGDTDLDAFIANYGANTVWINQAGAQGGAPGMFVDNGQRLGTLWSEAVALGDLDGDGDLDVFQANSNGPNKIWLNQSGSGQADLEIEVDAPAYVNSPRSFVATQTFTATVRNLGPSVARGVAVTFETEAGGSSLGVTGLRSGSVGRCDAPVSGLPDCPRWLFGDLAPGASATVLVSPINAVPFSYSGVIHSFAWTQVEVAGTVSEPDLSNNRASTTTHFWECLDGQETGCALEELLCEAQSSPRSAAGRLGQSLADAAVDLAVYYVVRANVMQGTPQGQHYIDLYTQHNEEISDLLDANAALKAQGLAALQAWEPGLWALVLPGGPAGSLAITAGQVALVDDFLDGLTAAAGPALQQAIAAERQALGPLDAFVGLTVAEARGRVVGYGLALPLVTVAGAP